MVDWEVRGAINVVEACAQTESVEKIVFTSSLTAAIWRENISSEKDIDERSWSNQDFCRKLKVLDFFSMIFHYLKLFYYIFILSKIYIYIYIEKLWLIILATP